MRDYYFISCRQIVPNKLLKFFCCKHADVAPHVLGVSCYFGWS